MSTFQFRVVLSILAAIGLCMSILFLVYLGFDSDFIASLVVGILSWLIFRAIWRD